LFSQALSYLGVYCRKHDVRTLGMNTVAKLLVGRELSALSSLLHRCMSSRPCSELTAPAPMHVLAQLQHNTLTQLQLGQCVACPARLDTA